MTSTYTLLKADIAELVRRGNPFTFPSFDEIHRRIARNRQRRRRANPCALIKLPEDDARPRRRKRRPNMVDGKMRGRADHGYEDLAWRAMEKAWERGDLLPGRDYQLAEIKRICQRAYCDMEILCMDLAEHRASVKVTHVAHNVWRFSGRFAEPAI